MIKKKTGIKSIADLLSFQPEEYFMEGRAQTPSATSLGDNVAWGKFIRS